MEQENNVRSENFRLESFEGPLDVLLHLIQKEEVEIFDLVLEELSSQLIKKIENSDPSIDEGAEAMWLISILVHLKSRKLLPPTREETEEEEDPRIPLMHHIIEYQRYKHAASKLSQREENQSTLFYRKIAPTKEKISPGLEEVNLSDLTELLSEVLTQAKKSTSISFQEDKWHIADKISWFEKELKSCDKIDFFALFTKEKCQEELIVLFLALLELMKEQKVQVITENKNIIIVCKHG